MNDYFSNLFTTDRVMVILRGQAPELAVELAGQAWDAGIRAVEVPIHTPAARASLEAVVREGRARGFEVGAGTVISTEQVDFAARAGAAYTVAPGLDVEVARASVASGLPHMPGVATATDIQAALAADLSWVKAFPASSLGLPWFRAMQGPFPDLNVVATGGIRLETAGDYLDAGIAAVGIGSGLDDIAALTQLCGRAAGA